MKIKKSYPEDGKTIAGLTLMSFTNQGAMAFMSMLFMLYLTDYAGIGTMGATLGTVLLLAGRIFDAVDDPLQGWIMDRAKPGKLGKYKPFVILSIILTTLSIVCLYSLPAGISDKPVLVVIWVSVFLFLFDIGTSFFAENPLKQSLTTDPAIRAKHVSVPAAFCMMISVPFAFFIAMVEGLNSSVNDMHLSFSIMTVIAMGLLLVLSLLGISMVKEGSHPVKDEAAVKLTLKDIVDIFRFNKPLLIEQFAFLFIGFISFLLYSSTTYYIKWAYCADLNTGAVNSDLFGLLSMIMGMLQMFPYIIGLFVAQKVLKAVNDDPVKLLVVSLLLIVVCGIGLFVCNLLGLLAKSYILFFIFIALMTVGLGMLSVPQNLLLLESMDYGIYKTGKETNAMCNALSKFINKAQQGVASAAVGAILIAIGYAVDSTTDTFIGDITQIPTMLDSFIVLTGIVPAVLAVVALVILRFYPVNAALRTEINTFMQNNAEENAQ